VEVVNAVDFLTGKAADVFGQMVAELGGPADFVEQAQIYLPKAPVIREIKATKAGTVSGIATRDIGLAVVALGGGRTRPQDKVDPAVGLTALAPLGAKISKGDALAVVHARSEAQADAAAEAVRAAYGLSADGAKAGPAVKRRVDRT
jgi:thymidine phosphorylase